MSTSILILQDKFLIFVGFFPCTSLRLHKKRESEPQPSRSASGGRPPCLRMHSPGDTTTDGPRHSHAQVGMEGVVRPGAPLGGGGGEDSGAQNFFATEEANKRARCITADLSNDVNKLKLQLQKRNHGMCNIYSVKCQLPVASLLLFCDICAHIDPLLTRATGVNVLVATQDRLHRSYSSHILSS